MKNFYKDLFEKLPVGYAYHKILCDENGVPCDYEYIDINPAFALHTGLSKKQIIGKKVSELIPEIREGVFDWISFYGDIALNGGEKEFHQYDSVLRKTFRIKAFSPEKYHFVTFFTDITEETTQSHELRTLITTLNDIVFELDREFNFKEVITQNESLLFLPRKELLGKSISQVFPAPYVDQFLSAFQKARISNQPQSIIYQFLDKFEGKWFNAEIKYLKGKEDERYIIKVSDVTDEKILEQERSLFKKQLDKNYSLEALIFEVSSLFIDTKAKHVDTSINHSLKILGEAVDADRAYVFKYDFQNNICTNTYEWCKEGILPEIDNLQHVDLTQLPTWTLRHTKNFPVYIEDVSLLDVQSEKAVLESQDIKSCLAVPMMKGSECYGFVGFDSVRQKRTYSEVEQRLLTSYGQRVLSLLVRKSYEEELEKTTAELEHFFSVNLDLLCIANTDGYFIKLNKSWETTLGYTLEELEGKRFLDLVHPDDLAPTIKAIEMLDGQEALLNFVNRYRTKDGEYRYIEWRSHPSGSFIYAAARDITERKLMEDALYFEKEEFKTTLLSIGDGVISVDRDQNIVFMNKVSETLTGWNQSESVGKPFQEVFKIVNEVTREKADDPILKVLNTGRVVELANHTALIKKDGTEIAIEDSAAPIRDKNGNIRGVVLVFRDVTEKKRIRSEIEYLSFHDYLTGLYNRRFFEEELLRCDKAINLPLSLIMLDVNGLKLTNDAFGHEMGDKLLKKVAEMIQSCCSGKDIIARIGGDEFAVILPKTDEAEAEEIKKKIIEASSRNTLESIIVSVAVGCDTKTSSTQDINSILKKSENNMYNDKLTTSRTMRNQTLQLIMETLNKKYENEQIHIDRVSQLCLQIGVYLKLPSEDLKELETAGFLHDIGKIMIPHEILNKPCDLTQEEFEQIQRHSEAGYQILKSVEEYSSVAEYALCHHERWDGTGYPRKLKGEEIPFFSRIISVADAYEAMTTDRPYRKAMNKDFAIKELINNSGTQFDPYVVEIFIKNILNTEK